MSDNKPGPLERADGKKFVEIGGVYVDYEKLQSAYEEVQKGADEPHLVFYNGKAYTKNGVYDLG